MSPSSAPRFVIQEHHATTRHWDLRLEVERSGWPFRPRTIPWRLLVKIDDEKADARRNPVSTEPESVKRGRTLEEVAEEEGI